MDVYRRLVESAPDAILVVEDHRIVFANPAAVTLAGMTRTDDLIGQSVLDRLHSDHHELFRQRLDEWRTGNSTRILDVSLRRDTPRRGLWLDTSDQTPEETTTEILTRLPEAEW